MPSPSFGGDIMKGMKGGHFLRWDTNDLHQMCLISIQFSLFKPDLCPDFLVDLTRSFFIL